MALEPVVVDTDLLIDFLRGRGPGVDAVERWLRTGQLRISAVSAYELRLGADVVDREEAIAALLSRRTLPFDLQCALLAGAASVRLRQLGTPIGIGDTMIAGTCLRYGVALASRNTSHFLRVEGLALSPLPG